MDGHSQDFQHIDDEQINANSFPLKESKGTLIEVEHWNKSVNAEDVEWMQKALKTETYSENRKKFVFFNL